MCEKNEDQRQTTIDQLAIELKEVQDQYDLLRATCPVCGEIRTESEANDSECLSCGMTKGKNGKI